MECPIKGTQYDDSTARFLGMFGFPCDVHDDAWNDSKSFLLTLKSIAETSQLGIDSTSLENDLSLGDCLEWNTPLTWLKIGVGRNVSIGSVIV